MSLKAKIEAVVYAAEEPVTLAQLAALFSDEALAYQREHQPELPLGGEVAEQKSLLDQGGTAAGVADAGGEGEPLPVEDAGTVEGAALAAVSGSWAPTAAQSSSHLGGSAAEGSSEGGDSSGGRAAEGVSLEVAPATVDGAAADELSDSDSQDEAVAGKAESPEAAEKRLARLRDREVKEILRGQLDELIREYAQSDRGIEIRQIAGGYRIGTKPEYHDSVRSFVKSLKPPMKLSLQALETLAVIAYKQPVTAPEVSEIRGVDTSGVLGSLISRKLITTAGRKQVIGRPILYKTTKEFLLRFGLKDVNELPSIEEFEKMAGELAEADVEEDPHVAAPEELPFFETQGGENADSEEGAADEVHAESGVVEDEKDAVVGEEDGAPVAVEAEYVTKAVSESVENDQSVTDAVADRAQRDAEAVVVEEKGFPSESVGDDQSVTDAVANMGKSDVEAVRADENGYPSEAQTVPGGAHELPEDLKEDR